MKSILTAGGIVDDSAALGWETEIKKYYSITEEIVHEDVEELGKDIKNATKKYSVEQSLYTDKLIKDSIS